MRIQLCSWLGWWRKNQNLASASSITNVTLLSHYLRLMHFPFIFLCLKLSWFKIVFHNKCIKETFSLILSLYTLTVLTLVNFVDSRFTAKFNNAKKRILALPRKLITLIFFYFIIIINFFRVSPIKWNTYQLF